MQISCVYRLTGSSPPGATSSLLWVVGRRSASKPAGTWASATTSVSIADGSARPATSRTGAERRPAAAEPAPARRHRVQADRQGRDQGAHAGVHRAWQPDRLAGRHLDVFGQRAGPVRAEAGQAVVRADHAQALAAFAET